MNTQAAQLSVNAAEKNKHYGLFAILLSPIITFISVVLGIQLVNGLRCDTLQTLLLVSIALSILEIIKTVVILFIFLLVLILCTIFVVQASTPHANLHEFTSFKEFMQRNQSIFISIVAIIVIIGFLISNILASCGLMYLISNLIHGFWISNFGSAFLGSLVIAVVNFSVLIWAGCKKGFQNIFDYSKGLGVQYKTLFTKETATVRHSDDEDTLSSCSDTMNQSTEKAVIAAEDYMKKDDQER